jgi:hypothetical protein
MSSGGPRVVAVLAGAAVLVYASFLGWDRSEDVDPVTGSTSGPYDTWQIACTAVALGLLAHYGGRAQHAWAASAAVSLGFTVAWSVGAATAPTEDANLWPVGAAFLLVGTLLSTAPVALLTQRFSRPSSPPARAVCGPRHCADRPAVLPGPGGQRFVPGTSRTADGRWPARPLRGRTQPVGLPRRTPAPVVQRSSSPLTEPGDPSRRTLDHEDVDHDREQCRADQADERGHVPCLR